MTDRAYDLVIVGAGAAALSAAVSFIETTSARGERATVALLERAPREMRGGSTRWTSAGLRLTPELELDPLWVGTVQEVSKGLADLAYTQRLEREVPTTVRFLQDHGVELHVFPANVAGLMRSAAVPIGGGHAIVEALAKVVEDHDGAEILYETEAVRLSLSGEGRVDGVVARGPDGLLRTLRAPAVVLACGGFEGNAEMLTQYCGANAVDLRRLAPGTQYNKGDGIRMAVEIGADTAGQFDGMHAELVDVRTDRPDPVLYGHPWTIVVNRDARRFYDEGATGMAESFELIAYEVWRNQDQTAYMITDEAVMSREDLTQYYDTDIPPVKADTIAELANLLGLEPSELVATVDEFNAACGDAEYDPSVFDGKATVGIDPPKSNWANPIAQPPFYGWPVAAAICFTYGGLRTDTDARVLSKNGAPIPGLYAAGELVGLFYHEYPSATSVLKALTFGRIAGVHVAEIAASALEPAGS